MSQFEATVKHLSGKTYKISVVPETTISELKGLIEKESQIPSAEIKLIFRGKILKAGDEKMKDLGISADTPISMIHQKPEGAEPPKVEGGAQAGSAAGGSAQQPPQNFFANMAPGSAGAGLNLDAMGLGGAGGMGIDQLQQVMNNPAVRQQVSSLMQNPEIIRNLLQSHPLGQQISQQNPQLAQMFSDPNFSSQLTGIMNMLGGAGGAGANPAQPETAAAPNQAPGATPNLPPINFSNLLGSFNPGAGVLPTGNPNDNPNLPPEERFKDQLVRLSEMGFVNKDLNLQALTQSMGNIDLAVEKLLSWLK